MVHIEKLNKYYGEKESRIRVLKDVSLDIGSGQIVCLLGPSGSGKSTLLNILGGIEKADGGEISAFGEIVSDLGQGQLGRYRRSAVGFVFQFYNLVGNLTIRENIELGAFLSKNPLSVDDVIHSLGLDEQKNKLPHQVSGGQAQRTSIARAIVKRPKLLICDEPTGALDYASAKDVLRLVEKIKREYSPIVVIATHNEQISKMCDMVVRLRDGRVESVNSVENPVSAEDVEW